MKLNHETKVNVIHWVEDLNTGKTLAGGQRRKDLSGLTYEGTTRIGMHRVKFYHRDETICGRQCRIIYCATSRRVKRCVRSYVTPHGRKYGLRGESLYEATSEVSRSRRRNCMAAAVALGIVLGLAIAMGICATHYLSLPAHALQLTEVIL